MTKPVATGISAKSTGQQLSAAEFNTINTTLNAVRDDYASISEGVDADTLEGSTLAQTQNHAPQTHGNEAHSATFESQANKGAANGYAPLGADNLVPSANLPEAEPSVLGEGETRTWNKLKGDIPNGWHICDGTNGTEDLSENTPSENTVYIQYIGGGYDSMTARTINLVNGLSEGIELSASEPINGDTITAIEDGAPFKFSITNNSGNSITVPIIICSRTTDNYAIFVLYLPEIRNESQYAITLTQYVDCTWKLTAD